MLTSEDFIEEHSCCASIAATNGNPSNDEEINKGGQKNDNRRTKKQNRSALGDVLDWGDNKPFGCN